MKGKETMKFKRFIVIVTFVLTLVLLVGCSKQSLNRTYDLSGNLPKTFLEDNATLLQLYNKELNEAFKLETVDNAQGVLSGKFLVTVKVEAGETKRGIYDLERQKELLEPIYETIIPQLYFYYDVNEYKSIRMHHFFVVDKNNRQGIYSGEEEKFIVALDLYESLNMVVNTFNLKPHETIYKKLVDEEEKVVRNVVIIDKEGNLTREELSGYGAGETINEEISYTFYRSTKLKDYYYRTENGVLTAYKNGKEHFKANLQKDNNFTNFVIDKYLYIQTRTDLAFDAKEYDFYDNGQKFLLKTSRIDLTNGSVKEYSNFDYLLIGSNQIKLDAKENQAYVASVVRKIVDKTLLAESRVLFNSELKEIVNLQSLNFGDVFYKVDENKFLVPSVGKIVNEKFETVLNLVNYQNITYIPHHNLISLSKNGLYGVIDTKGKIIIPFNYEIPFDFYNGVALNKAVDSPNQVFVDIQGEVTKLKDNDLALNVRGLLLNIEDNQTILRNYDNKVLLTLNGNYNFTNYGSIILKDGTTVIGTLVAFTNLQTGKIDFYIIKK